MLQFYGALKIVFHFDRVMIGLPWQAQMVVSLVNWFGWDGRWFGMDDSIEKGRWLWMILFIVLAINSVPMSKRTSKFCCCCCVLLVVHRSHCTVIHSDINAESHQTNQRDTNFHLLSQQNNKKNLREQIFLRWTSHRKKNSSEKMCTWECCACVSFLVSFHSVCPLPSQTSKRRPTSTTWPQLRFLKNITKSGWPAIQWGQIVSILCLSSWRDWLCPLVIVH